MEPGWQTFGHQTAKKILEKQLKAGRFPHAYLFLGPAGVGKKQLALEFAEKALGAKQLSNHPDFQVLEGAEDLSVEKIREFIAGISLMPLLSKRKVAVINDAQNLNQQGSNALLKTLEEPPSNIIIILVSSRPLLPTIMSRCAVLAMNAFSKNQMREFAEKEKIKAKEEIFDLSFGSPARLKLLAEDSSLALKENEGIKKINSLKTVSERLAAIAEYSDAETQDLQKMIESWFYWQAASLRQNPTEFAKVSALSDALVQLKTNKNKKMVLQSLFLKL